MSEIKSQRVNSLQQTPRGAISKESADPFNADVLTGEDGAQVDLLPPAADAATASDHDRSLVEGVMELRQPRFDQNLEPGDARATHYPRIL